MEVDLLEGFTEVADEVVLGAEAVGDLLGLEMSLGCDHLGMLERVYY